MDSTSREAPPVTAPDRPFLSRSGACDYLRARWGIVRTVATLNTMASRQAGPAFFKAGRQPLYAPGDLDAWAAGLIRQTPGRGRAA